jgi:hypothetical protein
MPAASDDGTAGGPRHIEVRASSSARDAERRTTTCRRLPICRQLTPRTDLMPSFPNLCVSHQTAMQAMKAPSRQAPPSRHDANMSASALRRSTELRGQRATRGGAGRMENRICVRNGRTAVHRQAQDQSLSPQTSRPARGAALNDRHWLQTGELAFTSTSRLPGASNKPAALP